jgi:hypothetical protein
MKKKGKGGLLSAAIIVSLLVGWLVFLQVTTEPVKLPVEVTQSAHPRAGAVPRSAEPPVTPTPGSGETKIYVVVKDVPSEWQISRVMSEWNLADRYVDFVPISKCIMYEPCLTVKMGRFEEETTAGETSFIGDGFSIDIIFNRNIKSSFIAKSVACHEFGHVLGMPHVKGTANTCMTAVDGAFRGRPSQIDSRLVNSFGEWGYQKMYELSGKDVDIRSMPS